MQARMRPLFTQMRAARGSERHRMAAPHGGTGNYPVCGIVRRASTRAI
jgi:hypothetical protein